MLQLKKILFLLTALFMAVSLSHAAVRSIADTEFASNRDGTTSSSEGGHTSSYSGVECGTQSADSAEGCNRLLGISNAVATACDGGRFNCSAPANPIPLASYPECDVNAVANSADCSATTNSQMCSTDDGTIKYNCRCRSEYVSCGASEYGDPATKCTDTAGDAYYQECLPVCPSGHQLVSASASCSYALSQSLAVKCFDTGSSTVRYDCTPDCSVFAAAQPSYSIRTQSECESSTVNGEVRALCYNGGVQNAVCGCNQDSYVENCGKKPDCSGDERPLGSPVCTAEKDSSGAVCEKMSVLCGVPACGPTDRTPLTFLYQNLQSTYGRYADSTLAAAVEDCDLNKFVSADSSLYADYKGQKVALCSVATNLTFVQNNGGGTFTAAAAKAAVCTCLPSYQYTSAAASDNFLTEHGLSKEDRAPNAEYVPVVTVNKTSGDKVQYKITDVCAWDAQSAAQTSSVNVSLPNYSSGGTTYYGQTITGSLTRTSALDLSKLRYKNAPQRICQAWEDDIIAFQKTDAGKEFAPSGNTCKNGGVIASCAKKVDLSAADVIVDGEIFAYNSSVEYYEQVSYCACPKDDEGNNLWYTTCPDGLLRGGKTCTMEGAVRYELCLPKCSTANGRKYEQLTSWNNDSSCEGIKQPMNGVYDASSPDGNSTFYSNNQSYLCLLSDAVSGEIPQWQCTCGIYKSNEECALVSAGAQGAGATCLFDSTDTDKITKYENCLTACPTEKSAWLEAKDSSGKVCMYETYSGATECYQPAAAAGEEGQTMYLCSCPTYVRSVLEECGGRDTGSAIECDAACQKCHTEQKIGLGTACAFDSRDAEGNELDYLKKYNSFGNKCTWFQSEAGSATLTIKTSSADCGTWAEGNPVTEICYEAGASAVAKYICGCPVSYKSLEEFCTEKVAAGETDVNGQPYTAESCKAAYKGIGTKCSFDVKDGANVDKYRAFGVACPNDDNRVKNDVSACKIGEYNPIGTTCYKEGNNGIENVVCSCPESFNTKCYTDDTNTVIDAEKIRGGLACTFSDETQYEKCLPQCENTTSTPVVLDPDSCPMIDGVQADTGEMCFNKFGDETAMYVCRCPKSQGYQTIEEYCSSQKDENGNPGIYYQGRFFNSTECKSRFIGVGAACTFDGNGSVKYKSFSVVCPTDRPLYYSADECTSTSMPGSLDYYCYESSNLLQQRVVCKCPDTWVDVNGNRKVNGTDTRVCSDTEEASGMICSFDGSKNIKYEKCYTRCDKMNTNGKGVSYLEEEDAYELDCKNLLGDGATFGVDGFGGQCSQNHTLAYPCYCSSTYTEQCLNTDNKTPAPGALACTVGGSTYYEECANNSCAEESSTIAIIEDTNTALAPETLCRNAGYGPGVSGKRCGEKKVECSCNAREYSETCEYPYEKPDKNEYSWCKYGSNGTLMKDGVEHFKLGECTVKPTLALCGEYILNNDGTQNTSYTINVAATESQCAAKFGTGARTQLCEYADNPNKRAYNCYYNPAEFIWTEDNCPVRHILSTNYIIKGNVRYYDSCDCHPAYKNHKYNCAGMLSGGTCNQKLTAEIISADSTLRAAAGNGLIGLNDTLSFYPYCQCTADYNQECDGERNIGVGEPCNGKYKACECKPDALPENWADNYYGCPGGKKPTGVTKPNGCGGKYYQCEVTECTWQHSEKCLSPLVGIDPCQDNEGNIGGYKSCKCPDGYVLCPDGTVGTGEPCMLKGQYYYKEGSCISKETCTHGESQTCQGSLQIGVNPCNRNGVTYFEYCVCASGYDKACNGDNEVGVGTFCTLNGTKYYTECSTPASTCTSEHKDACDTNQSSYDPCVNSDNKIMYKCKCPANWKKCETEGAGTNAESCTDSSGTYYSACAVTNECTSYQDKTYAVCNEYQVGTGGSCVSVSGDTSVIKYAQCEETSACRLNGYQYTCQGYDQGGLGDSCVDENGNRLYKSCDCPTNWVECPGKNNTKGRSCTPLGETGILGKTVYESCTCDRSIYKATCEATDSNKGVVPSKTRSCTEVIYGAGEQPTYYESCECSSPYKYTCTANGQTKDDNDYCQKTDNGEKLYTHCECENDYSQTCAYDPANPGLTKPKDANKACTPLNSDTGDNTTKYTACECGAYYTETCSDPNHIKADAYKCTMNGIDKYNQCDCLSAFAYSCKASGNNKGILPPGVSSSQSCTQVKYVNGQRTATTMYSECQCATGYKFSCNKNEPDGTANDYTYSFYGNVESDYCEIPVTSGEGESAGTGWKRTYQECKCNSSFNTECTGANEEALDDAEFCLNVDKNGNATKLYQTCACKPNSTDGYEYTGLTIERQANEHPTTFGKTEFNKLSASNQAYLKEKLKECVYYKNANLILDGCGKLYFKCIDKTSKYYVDEEESGRPTNCHASDSSSVWVVQDKVLDVPGSLGTVAMYKSCDCDPNKYNAENQWCPEMAAKTRNGSGMCYKKGHDGREESWDKTDVSCAQICHKALVSESTCRKANGDIVYAEENGKCFCNRNFFNKSDWSWHNGSGSYWYNVCVDSRGTVYQGFNRGQTAGDGTCNL